MIVEATSPYVLRLRDLLELEGQRPDDLRIAREVVYLEGKATLLRLPGSFGRLAALTLTPIRRRQFRASLSAEELEFVLRCRRRFYTEGTLRQNVVFAVGLIAGVGLFVAGAALRQGWYLAAAAVFVFFSIGYYSTHESRRLKVR